MHYEDTTLSTMHYEDTTLSGIREFWSVKIHRPLLFSGISQYLREMHISVTDMKL